MFPLSLSIFVTSHEMSHDVSYGYVYHCAYHHHTVIIIFDDFDTVNGLSIRSKNIELCRNSPSLPTLYAYTVSTCKLYSCTVVQGVHKITGPPFQRTSWKHNLFV